jgi:dihydrofolate synthase/folylpolyglutamate synthase
VTPEASPHPPRAGGASPASPRGRGGTVYREALDYLAGFVDVERGGVPAGTINLDRIRQLLAALGEPQQQYPSVLIAGTKGKGSTAAMVERALRAAGRRTGLYTQPHLHTIRERVRIDGEPITPAGFAAEMAAVRAAVERVCDATAPTTAYEVMTALAFDHFARSHVDIAVVEVGLGGRLDATNVLDASVSAITSISLDHTQILGDTVEAIAREKADIIKPGRPCVSAPQPPSAMAVIRETATARGSPLLLAGENGARWDDSPHELDLITARGRIPHLTPALHGGFQRINIAVAASILDALDETAIARTSLDDVRTGIEEVVWPGRFEIVEGAPPTVIDGAHNGESAQRLREALAAEYPSAGIVLVLGVARDKDLRAILDGLLPARLVVATRAQHPRAADPELIAAMAATAGAEALVETHVASALRRARGLARDGEIVVATGSLYVVAEAREALGLAPPGDEPAFDPWATPNSPLPLGEAGAAPKAPAG